MQKWHVHGALGRAGSGTFRVYGSLNRQFSLSSQAQENYNGGRRQPSDISYRSFKPTAIDARDLAAVPNPTPPPPRRHLSDRIPAERSPLDARNLGARPPSDGPRISRVHVGTPDDRGPRTFTRRDPSDRQFQGGSTNASHTRTRGPPNAARTPRSGAGGAKKPRAAPRTGTSAGGGREDRGEVVSAEPSKDEIEYLRTINKAGIYDAFLFGGAARQYTTEDDFITYTPAELSAETLRGMGPTLACGQWGMTETVTERMMKIGAKKDAYDKRIEELAHKWGEGEFCHFRSKQEKEDTIKTVERNLAGTGDNAKLDEKKEAEKMTSVDTRMKEEGERLAERLLKGDYNIGPPGKGPTAELLERYTRKNETYLPKDREALAGKIGTLLPLETPSATANSAR
ncbi:MAG: hypothetical protein L6R39_002530 [Caloplaca ligustica]|nr:MAG: hypothetical protein L6R39_002530 [Caloplaca ligustica]